jgi:hypothetical protein
MLRLDRRSALFGFTLLAAGAGSLAGALESPGYGDPDAIYAALRKQKGQPLDIRGGRINIVFADEAPGIDRNRVIAWIRTAATAVSIYFGRFPVRDYGLLVVAQPGDSVGHATTYGYGGSATLIHVGVEADEAAFARDWVLVHEMVHTALPNLPRRALWLQEGNATWVEPVARAQAGQLPAAEVWRQALRGMPYGLKDTARGGLDGTSDWGQLYWGGAIFWLKAEISIYERTHGRLTLRDALRAINRASGGNGSEWSPEEMMAAGDRATGTTALGELYRTFSTTGIETDLRSLFEGLGVSAGPGSEILFNRQARLAELTRRIVRP